MRRTGPIATVIVALLTAWPAPATGEARQAAATPQQEEGHAGHGGDAGAEPTADAPGAAVHSMHTAQTTADAGIPPLTDADRAAAFPDVQGHALQDNALHYYVLLDQLEFHAAEGSAGGSWDGKGWFGRDVSRFWFRTEGERLPGGVEHAEGHFLYGRAIARWWDVVGGVRQDVRPGAAQTWAAVGVQGLAPYWFEVEATGYVGASGRTHFRFETEYELLLTNRVVLRPLVEFNVYGKADPERGIGAGLSAAEVGLRLRYELRREVAPYVGVVWNRKFLGTADFADAAGEPTGGARLAGGVRLWF